MLKGEVALSHPAHHASSRSHMHIKSHYHSRASLTLLSYIFSPGLLLPHAILPPSPGPQGYVGESVTVTAWPVAKVCRPIGTTVIIE